MLIDTADQLENILTAPTAELIQAISSHASDLLILGVGGKMGPTLAKLAKRAFDKIGVRKKVIGVSRFTSSEIQRDLESHGVETIQCDLLNQNELDTLPDVANVISMVGRKFGSGGNEPLTWAMNTYLSGMIMNKFRNSKVVALSTGNVYPLVPVTSGGSKESDAVAPIGEYAQSCLGRERIIEYWSNHLHTPVTIIRLNYAIDLRYGVLLDVAQKVAGKIPIDLRMGYVNVIWQGDANSGILLSFQKCSTPPTILNMTGAETISIRWLASRFGELFLQQPTFINEEGETALLSNANKFHSIFPFAKISLEQMIDWSAHWVSIGGTTLNKPTRFEEREGKF